jgi:hypothetical protein
MHFGQTPGNGQTHRGASSQPPMFAPRAWTSRVVFPISKSCLAGPNSFASPAPKMTPNNTLVADLRFSPQLFVSGLHANVRS